ncbi:MAG: thiamine-phosphate kinase [Alphaproteobacteria bacterium]
MTGEFERITRYFKPHAAEPAARGLADDAAVLSVPDGHELVISTDTAVSGVHFLHDAPADVAAQRAIGSALSDLAAMGADPVGMTIAISLPPEMPLQWLDDFAATLGEDCKRFNCPLLGGDTTGIDGPPVINVTVFGTVPRGQAIGRNGAQLGDLLYVSGEIGGAGLGIEVLQGGFTALPRDLRQDLAHRHEMPEPRLSLGPQLRGVATAMLDISDGLLADAAHIATTSNVVLQVDLRQLPLPVGARVALNAELVTVEDLASFGDDYELLFTAPADAKLPETDIPLTCIGKVVESGEAALIRPDGQAYDLTAGWDHFDDD